jgi:hypothetical protein
MLFSDFKARVAKDFSERVASDKMFEDAVTAYVQSEFARGAGDMTRYKTYRGTYRNLRYGLTQYAYTQDLDALKNEVYVRLRGTADLDKTLVEVCSKFVAYQSRLEVDRDDKMAATLEKLYNAGRLKVIGHAYVGDAELSPEENAAAFNVRVRKYLPIDNSRRNFSETGGLLDLLIEAFTEEQAALTAQVGEFIESAQEDLSSSNQSYNQDFENCLFEFHTLIPEYKPLVMLTYDFTKVESEGNASRPTTANLLPSDAHVERIRIRWPKENDDGNLDWEESGVRFVPWSSREFLTHDYHAKNEEPKVSLDGQGSFLVYPQLVSGFPAWVQGAVYAEGDYVEYGGVYYQAASAGTSSGGTPLMDAGVVWDQIDQTRPIELLIWYKSASLPSDSASTLYTALMAKSVAEYLRHHALLRVGGRDQEAGLALQNHRRLRRLVLAELQTRKENGDKLDPFSGLTNPINTAKATPFTANPLVNWDLVSDNWEDLASNWG